MRYCFASYLGLVLLSSVAWSMDEGENVWNYDAIVNQLSQTRTSSPAHGDPFSDIEIHGGLGFVTSYTGIKAPKRQNSSDPHIEDRSGFLNGIEAYLGIDLFSERWMAEGAVRSFGTEEFSSARISLHEFDLRIVHRPFLSERLRLRVGAGLAARYLDYRQLPTANSEGFRQNYNTPASILLLGLDLYVTRAFSLGAETAWRSSLIEDTLDNSAFDAYFRLNGHF